MQVWPLNVGQIVKELMIYTNCWVAHKIQHHYNGTWHIFSCDSVICVFFLRFSVLKTLMKNTDSLCWWLFLCLSGLDLNVYKHFTSPIRCYDGIVMHRLLKEVLRLSSGQKVYTSEELNQISNHIHYMNWVSLWLYCYWNQNLRFNSNQTTGFCVIYIFSTQNWNCYGWIVTFDLCIFISGILARPEYASASVRSSTLQRPSRHELLGQRSDLRHQRRPCSGPCPTVRNFNEQGSLLGCWSSFLMFRDKVFLQL